eukprot:SAG11_NODE_26426_length_345_cov_1.048780_1_plen_30_part_10
MYIGEWERQPVEGPDGDYEGRMHGMGVLIW